MVCYQPNRLWRPQHETRAERAPVKTTLNVFEFDILAYLHEHACGFEPAHALDLSVMAQTMGRGFSRAISYLKGTNYVNVLIPRNDNGLTGVRGFLTIKGEDAARDLEQRLIEKGILIDGTPTEMYSALQGYPVSYRADIVQEIQEPDAAVQRRGGIGA